MYVCICNAITDTEIRRAAKAGIRDLWSLQMELGVAAGCGSCQDTAVEILKETTEKQRRFEPRLFEPALA